MKPRNHLPAAFSVLLIAALLVACAGQQATPTVVPVPPTATPVPPTVTPLAEATPVTTVVVEPYGNRADAPPYAVQGPYSVGVREFKIEPANENDRPLTVSVWYPALNPEGTKEVTTYEMDFAPGDTPNFPAYGYAIADAKPDLSGGPYPLVVYTHAHWTFRQEMPYLVEHLASRGFVIIAADHQDNWSTLFGAKPWQIEFQRPNEVRRQIDFAEGLNATGQALAGMIDTDHVGVAGWSGGSETALVAAGARLDLARFRAWCDKYTVDGKVPDTDCVDILDHQEELAALAGLDAVPQGLWPDWSDERIAAAVAMGPWVGSIGEEGLQAVKTPTLLLIGSADTSVGPTYREFKPFQHILAEPRAEVTFDNAEHILFFSDCDAIPGVVDLGFFGFCADPVWNMDRAHDLINHFVTAFLLSELKDDGEAAKALAPENATFTGVEYQAVGYGAAKPPAEPPAPQGLRPDASAYALRGPHAVGVRDFVIDTPERQIPVTVWYPALNPGRLPEAITYELDFLTNAQPNFTIAGQALADATPDLSGGPYPLLVHSHAGWTFRQDMAYLMEHLASQGFVVMAAGHEDNWGMLMENFYKSEISRPREVSNEIDFAEALTADDGELAGLIDTEHVAVSGWSIGGQVALEKAGARLNLVEQQENYCATMRDLDVRCSFYATPIEEMAKLAGLEALPEGDWPDWRDPRVDAIVLFEPSEGSLGALPVEVQTPVLLIEGTIDDPGYGWEGIASKEKTAAILENAGHVVFMNDCTAQPGMSEGGFYGVCSDPVWDVNRVHDLVNHFVTAFLKAEFKDDAEAAKALAPENVAFTGVEYQTTAYGTAP